MKSNHTKPYIPGDPLPRSTFLVILRTALSLTETRFVREAALHWLRAYPGDLEVKLVNARALYMEKGAERALPLLEELSWIDPHWYELQKDLHAYYHSINSPLAADAAACVIALGGRVDSGESIPDWGQLLLKARLETKKLNIDQASLAVQRAVIADPPTPLAASFHLETTSKDGQTSPTALQSLAEHYQNRWPQCAQISLYLADALMTGGESERAVAILHQVAAADVAGQTASRMWGTNHPYAALWPDELEAPLEITMPASVAVSLGWNQLTTAPAPVGKGDPSEAILPDASQEEDSHEADSQTTEPSAEKGTDGRISEEESGDLEVMPTEQKERLLSVQAELDKLAARIKMPHLAKADGRYPVYLVFTTRKGLVSQYGEEGADLVHDEMVSLVETMQKKSHWDSLLVYGDEASSTTPLGIKPARPSDPWGLKLVLSDLDEKLRKRGERIGALLIIGGPEVVPFHHLPNPVDDDDPDVASDNPYATRDENYFIPEWPVGRLPGGKSRNPALLIKVLKKITHSHEGAESPDPWYRRWIQRVLAWIRGYQAAIRPSFGYTAAAWRKASLSVFRPIGEARAMLASPPTLAEHLPWNGLTTAQLGYYNLHGLIDASEWFGQRDPGQSYDGPDYPIALRPQDIHNSGRSPRVVFSEACFGANIIEKDVEEAMALKFLSAGSQAVVGSTGTSYGSIATPLIAADLLGHTFWQLLKDGNVAGEALRQAKIQLAEEMNRRQGYLDGEDQKTLISFVLYGDPLAMPQEALSHPKAILRQSDHPVLVKTICDRAEENGASPKAPPDVLDHVRQVVEQYLPGMADATMRYSHEHGNCEGQGHQCPTSDLRMKSQFQKQPNRRVVTLSKQVETENKKHPNYARLTLDQQGKVVKLAVSR